MVVILNSLIKDIRQFAVNVCPSIDNLIVTFVISDETHIKIGINTAIEQLDVNDYYTKMYDGNTQITLGSMGSDVMTVPGLLYMFTQEYPWYGGLMVNNPAFDEVVLKVQRNVLEEEEKRTLTIQALEMFYDMAEWVPLFEKSGNYSYGPNVEYDYPITAITSVYYLNKVMPSK